MIEQAQGKAEGFAIGSFLAFIVMGVVVGGIFGCPTYNRYQVRMDETNQIQVNELKIQQTAQLVNVETQKAQIRVAEAKGISESQKIINATLTDRYLQHEAINAQEKMANSPNHTEIYIPSGNNGIPLVKTIDEQPGPSDSKK